MTYTERQPCDRLRSYVECYWSNVGGMQPGNVRVLPDGCADIIFSSCRNEPIGLSVVGLMTVPVAHETPPGQAYFGVRFRPGMAAAFIPEAAELTDKVEPLESFWPANSRLLVEQLSEAATLDEMAAIVERALRPCDPPDPAQRALYRLSAAGRTLDEVIGDAGVSARHFRRVCLERAGVSPKYLSRILRFRRAVERMRSVAPSSAQPKWAQFAAACGYYDQAHFIREFTEFAGVTPGRFLQSR